MKKILGDTRLMLKCCVMYYENEMGQNEIAQKLGISRPTVSKLLKEAKERGYLRIEIVGPQEQNCYKLERELEEKFGLKEAIVVEDKHDDIFQKEELGAEVAKYLYRIIQEGDIIGVSMGTTLKMIPQYAKVKRFNKIEFIPLVGGIGEADMTTHSNQLVVELSKGMGGKFKLLHGPAIVSNENIINIITGPNMAGKSTYMRQSAIIVLMAHMGSFVPADFADIPICDRIFTRVGASDDLSSGQSTFMVEMNEVSQILKNATSKSFVILDEIGRGTSTYDGISLAWAIVEYIQSNIKCKTLFATHYHELTDLENEFREVKNYSISVKDDGENIIFLRKIVEQPADKSYGIYVAKLAKLPDQVIERSSEILSDLEKNHIFNGEVLTGNFDKGKIAKTNSEVAITSTEHISKEVVKESDNKSLYNAPQDLFSFENELNKIENSNLKNEYDSLKLEHETLLKEHKKMKKDYNKLNANYTKLKEEDSQISFGNITPNSEVLDELLNLDILNMNLIDCVNTLYNLQKKAKENK